MLAQLGREEVRCTADGEVSYLRLHGREKRFDRPLRLMVWICDRAIGNEQ